MPKKKNEITIHSAAAEYMTYAASAGNNSRFMGICYTTEDSRDYDISK